MKKVRIAILIGILGLALIGGGVYFFLTKLKPAQAGILIESTPSATVFINGEQVGRTPFEGKRAPGEVVVKLVPITFDQPLAPWETRLTLTPGIRTVVRRTIGDSEDTSSGDVISFEKIAGGVTAISVVSTPDAAQVSLDGQVRGFTPIRINAITPGEHQLVVSAPNYLERTLAVRSETNYRLTAVVKLARSSEASPSASPTPTDSSKPETKEEVEILNTPTGFLRVRTEASTVASEAARVKPGQRFPFVSENQTKDWYKIEYEKGKEGWVSSQYAKKVTAGLGASPSPSPKASPRPSPTPRATP